MNVAWRGARGARSHVGDGNQPAYGGCRRPRMLRGRDGIIDLGRGANHGASRASAACRDHSGTLVHENIRRIFCAAGTDNGIALLDPRDIRTVSKSLLIRHSEYRVERFNIVSLTLLHPQDYGSHDSLRSLDSSLLD